MTLIFFTKFLKGLSVEEVGKTVKALGFDGLDLAVRAGQCVSPENVATALPDAVNTWKGMGLSVPLASMETRQSDPRDADVRRLFEACGKAKIPDIKIGYWGWKAGQPYWPAIDAIRKDLAAFQELGRQFGVRTLLHTHSGNYYGSNAGSAVALVRDCDPRFVGVYLDIAHLMVNGEPLDMALAMLGDRLAMAAAKNCRYILVHEGGPSAVWKREWCLLEHGLVDWRKALELLNKAGYKGPLSVHGEYAGPEDREAVLANVAKDIAFLHKIIPSGD